ncbi:hypothetical protein CLROS_037860 [Clostridium felsineum]|uniref:Uncharacterized protein n=1 Tax=Clostridium felsineum TaxID=36839 RepID=A0A1S8L2G9_9CLOT|nr:hypothetical protein CLROS_037860 [Clostridium felsineum]URZ13435.1 hypothetical protein CROST_042010 [Clostridium felsineum]
MAMAINEEICIKIEVELFIFNIDFSNVEKMFQQVFYITFLF